MTKSESRSNQFQFQKLWQELPTMNLWDNKNYDSGSHDFIETVAWASRRIDRFRIGYLERFRGTVWNIVGTIPRLPDEVLGHNG